MVRLSPFYLGDLSGRFPLTPLLSETFPALTFSWSFRFRFRFQFLFFLPQFAFNLIESEPIILRDETPRRAWYESRVRVSIASRFLPAPPTLEGPERRDKKSPEREGTVLGR